MKKYFSLAHNSFLILGLLLLASGIYAQNDSISGPALLDQLISDAKYEQASDALAQQLSHFKSQGNYDTLVSYIKYVGSFKLADDDKAVAIKSAETLVTELIAQENASISRAALLELAWLHDDAGQPKEAYEITKQALNYAEKIADTSIADIETIQYQLGIRASDMGNIGLAKKHHLTALKLRKANPKKDYEGLYSIYNAVGGMMWHSAKLDSAMYFYKEALEALKNMEPNPMNSYYRPSLVQSNIGVLLQATGKVEEGIDFCKDAISNIQNYLKAPEDESKKLRAEKFKLLYVDNLGAFYHSVGEFKKAEELINYSYQEKLKFLDEDDPKIMISLIILGEAKMGLRDYEKAGEYLDQALKILQKDPNSQFYWHGAALISRASVYDELGDAENAEKFYTRGEALYKRSLQGQYTKDYLDEFIEMSLFYAKRQKPKKALSLAMEGYNFTRNSSFKNTVQEFLHLLNLAEVHYKLKNYGKALEYSEKSLALSIEGHAKEASRVDSILVESGKPKAILIKARTQYNLNNTKDETFLKELLQEIERAIGLLERKRTIISTYEDLNLLVSENADLFNFAKKIRLDLYNASGDENYLLDLLSIHESSIYSRIRSRLDIKKNMAFAGLPQTILDRERHLKQVMNTALTTNTEGTDAIQEFFQASANWTNFLDSLKLTHPRYHKMRYATIEEPLDKLEGNIPTKTTIVRYMFIDGDLYAFVIKKEGIRMVALNFDSVKGHITKLNQGQHNVESTAVLLYELYQQLWNPINDVISTEKVLIIPDGALFNLSFEMLTPTKVATYKDLVEESILSKHTVSYNYSLLLLDEARKKVDYGNNFVAFVPEFSSSMKQDYQLAITDSIDLDKTYLHLLPQPFSMDLAEKFTARFKGSSFLNEKASKQVFTNNAREHKIIHIGTHAESNNVSPELSRLIFAKNPEDDFAINDNYLYTYEIYNQNLNSNLAILTACETGKP
ncbi:MAG: tetratricopeptide repeat protein, partial [Flavobacteriaceae bacterium]